jgi:putative ATPase
LQTRMQNYDKSWEGHYNLISALHKSVRGSDPDAALYRVSRILQWWEDPKFLLRRMIRMSVEDIWLSEPNALSYAVSATNAYERLWSPEWDLIIAELAIYLATCPKSNKAYVAFWEATDFAKKNGSLPPPKHIINAPTKLMQKQWFWAGYIYDPDTIDGFSGQNYFPEDVERKTFYTPIEIGFEREIKKRIDYWNALRRKKEV